MFNPLRTEVTARFGEVETFFGATRPFRDDIAATAKGLAFVHVYAAYEFTVKGAVQTAIDTINSHNHMIKDMTPPLMTLYLDRELSSLRDIGMRNIWSARLALFQRIFSNDVIALANNTGPPTDGTHYRRTHLITICNAFGITRVPVRRRRHLFRIDEVVGNRNEIAHGGETAASVGRRYSRGDITQVIRQMKSVCLFVIETFDGFCADTTRHRRN
jgi:hypothetical protein